MLVAPKSELNILYNFTAYRHFGSGGQLGFATDDKFMGPEWHSYTRAKSEAWLNFYTDWLENNNLDNILVLHYENLKENLELVLIFSFSKSIKTFS